jgi:hypothetical protein
MSFLAEKAAAARWLAAQIRQDRLSDDEAAHHWRELETSLADCRSNGARARHRRVAASDRRGPVSAAIPEEGRT